MLLQCVGVCDMYIRYVVHTELKLCKRNMPKDGRIIHDSHLLENNRPEKGAIVFVNTCVNTYIYCIREDTVTTFCHAKHGNITMSFC